MNFNLQTQHGFERAPKEIPFNKLGWYLYNNYTLVDLFQYEDILFTFTIGDYDDFLIETEEDIDNDLVKIKGDNYIVLLVTRIFDVFYTKLDTPCRFLIYDLEKDKLIPDGKSPQIMDLQGKEVFWVQNTLTNLAEVVLEKIKTHRGKVSNVD